MVKKNSIIFQVIKNPGPVYEENRIGSKHLSQSQNIGCTNVESCYLCSKPIATVSSSNYFMKYL